MSFFLQSQSLIIELAIIEVAPKVQPKHHNIANFILQFATNIPTNHFKIVQIDMRQSSTFLVALFVLVHLSFSANNNQPVDRNVYVDFLFISYWLLVPNIYVYALTHRLPCSSLSLFPFFISCHLSLFSVVLI